MCKMLLDIVNALIGITFMVLNDEFFFFHYISLTSGFPTLNARQEALSRALDASLDQLNSQSWGRNLLKLSHTGVTKIKPLQQVSGTQVH